MDWLEGIAFTVSIIGLIFAGLTVRKIKRMDTKSTEELQTLISKPNKSFLYGPAIEELKKRNEDYAMVLPNLIEKSISGNFSERVVVWGVIESTFPEISNAVEYQANRPSKEAKSILRGLIE